MNGATRRCSACLTRLTHVSRTFKTGEHYIHPDTWSTSLSPSEECLYDGSIYWPPYRHGISNSFEVKG